MGLCMGICTCLCMCIIDFLSTCCQGLSKYIVNFALYLGNDVKQAVESWISEKISKLKQLKDQIMFAFFSLFIYVIDIASDVYQAIDYWM